MNNITAVIFNYLIMRSAISISLPNEKRKEIRETAKKRGLTVSRYILRAVEAETALISEEEVLADWAEVEQARKNGTLHE
jgi:hypothetical protein